MFEVLKKESMIAMSEDKIKPVSNIELSFDCGKGRGVISESPEIYTKSDRSFKSWFQGE